MNVLSISKIIPSYKTFAEFPSTLKAKTSEIAFKIFEKLADYFLTTLDIIWPLKHTTSTPKGKLKSEIGQAAKRVLKDLENKNETREERRLIAEKKEKERYFLQAPTTGLFLGINYALVPFTLFQITAKENFIASAITAANITNILSWYCYGKLDIDFLEKYGLVRKQKEPDEIGRFFYDTTLFLTFKKIHEISPWLSPHLNAAFTLMQAPFLKDFFLKLPLVCKLNEKLHRDLNHIKAKTKEYLAYSLVKTGIYTTEQLLLPKLDNSLVTIEEKRPQWSKNFFFIYLSSIASQQAEESACDLAMRINDKLSDHMAEGIIKGVINGIKSLIYLHYLNRMLTYSIISHPLVSVSQLILSGGISQEPVDFGLRIGGALTLLKTGSPKLAFAFIYLPKIAINFFRMRKRQLKKIKRDDPLCGIVTPLFTNTIKTIRSSKGKEEIKSEKIIQVKEKQLLEKEGSVDSQKNTIKEETPKKEEDSSSYINYALAGAATALLKGKIPFPFGFQNNLREEEVMVSNSTLSQPKKDAEFEEIYQNKILKNSSKENTATEISEETNPLLAEFLKKNPARL